MLNSIYYIVLGYYAYNIGNIVYTVGSTVYYINPLKYFKRIMYNQNYSSTNVELLIMTDMSKLNNNQLEENKKPDWIILE